MSLHPKSILKTRRIMFEDRIIEDWMLSQIFVKDGKEVVIRGFGRSKKEAMDNFEEEIIEEENSKVKRLCWLLGHTEIFNDSGYGVCSCGTHAYYEPEDWNRVGLLYIPIHLFRKIEYKITNYLGKYFSRCYDCNKFDIAFGRHVGKHDNCLPF